MGCSPWGRTESDTTERLHFHFSLSCIGEGNGNPLQCSCLESPRDRGAWWAAVYGVAQSRTRLKRLSSSSSSAIAPPPPVKVKGAQSCPTLCDPMDCSLSGSSIHGIFQGRVLEWGAIAFSEVLWSFHLFPMDLCYGKEIKIPDYLRSCYLEFGLSNPVSDG